MMYGACVLKFNYIIMRNEDFVYNIIMYSPGKQVQERERNQQFELAQDYLEKNKSMSKYLSAKRITDIFTLQKTV